MLSEHQEDAAMSNQKITLWEIVNSLIDILRGCIVPILAVLLFSSFLLTPQTHEFFYDLLLVCGSEPGRCGQDMGIKVSALQFLIFEILSFVFSLLSWYVCRMLMNSHFFHEKNGHIFHLVLRRWIPRVIGFFPIFFVSLTMLIHYEPYMDVWQLVVGLLWACALLALPFMLRVIFPKNLDNLKMLLGVFAGVFGIVFCCIHPLDSKWQGLIFMTPFFIVTIFYLSIMWRLIDESKYRLISVCALVFMNGLAISSISIAAGSVTSMQKWTWTIAIAFLLPPLYLIFVVFRRSFGWEKLLDRWLDYKGYNASVTQWLGKFMPRLHSQPIFVLIIVLMLISIFCVLAVQNPLMASNFLFAPATVLLWLIFVFTAATITLYVLPLVMRFVLTLVFGLFWYMDTPPKLPLAVAEVTIQKDACKLQGVCLPNDVIGARYKAWQALHGGDSDTGPIILVAAAGGGATAATHTSARLAAADGATCGMFGDRIFAISAVSGGAFGAATYSALRRDLPDHGINRVKCLNASDDAKGAPLAVPLLRLNSADHLSAMIIRMLYSDLPLGLIPSKFSTHGEMDKDYFTRSGILSDSWLQGYKNTLDLMLNEMPFAARNEIIKHNTFMSDDDNRVGYQEGTEPLLLFNATSMQDGRRVVISQPKFCPEDGYCSRSNGLLQNALDSARFPGITPSHNRDVFGWNPWVKERIRTQRSIADGGYFDNSGVVTLIDVIEGLRNAQVDLKRVKVVLISSNPREGEPAESVENDADSGLKTQLLSPLWTVINVRDGRTWLALYTLERILTKDNVIHWSLSKNSLNDIKPEIAALYNDPPEKVEYERLHGKPQRNESELRAAPPLTWALSRDSANFVWLYAYNTSMAYANPERTKFPSEQELVRELLILQPH